MSEIKAPLPIAPCPNPECGNPCRVTKSGWGQGYKMVICGDSDGFCGYEGPISKNEAECIRLHNLIASPDTRDLGERADKAAEVISGRPRISHDAIREAILRELTGFRGSANQGANIPEMTLAEAEKRYQHQRMNVPQGYMDGWNACRDAVTSAAPSLNVSAAAREIALAAESADIDGHYLAAEDIESILQRHSAGWRPMPEGYKLVPIEPTEEVIKCGNDVIEAYDTGTLSHEHIDELHDALGKWVEFKP